MLVLRGAMTVGPTRMTGATAGHEKFSAARPNFLYTDTDVSNSWATIAGCKSEEGLQQRSSLNSSSKKPRKFQYFLKPTSI